MSSPGLPLVVLTRPEGRNEGIARALQASGVAVSIAPALLLRPVDGPVPAPEGWDMLVFVSRQAVEQYFARWRGPWPAATLAAAVGQATARALCQRVPAQQVLAPANDSAQDSEALLALLDARGLNPDRVLILRGRSGREWLATRLESRGCQVERHVLYDREPARWTLAQCRAAVDARPCVLLVSSLEGLASIAASLDAHGLGWPPVLSVVTIHERIARRLQCMVHARKAGTSPQATLDVKICAPDEQAIFQAILAASRLR